MFNGLTNLVSNIMHYIFSRYKIFKSNDLRRVQVLCPTLTNFEKKMRLIRSYLSVFVAVVDGAVPYKMAAVSLREFSGSQFLSHFFELRKLPEILKF